MSARFFSMDGTAHVFGDCCQDKDQSRIMACEKCGRRAHFQPVYGGYCTMCEVCDEAAAMEGSPEALEDEIDGKRNDDEPSCPPIDPDEMAAHREALERFEDEIAGTIAAALASTQPVSSVVAAGKVSL